MSNKPLLLLAGLLIATVLPGCAARSSAPPNTPKPIIEKVAGQAQAAKTPETAEQYRWPAEFEPQQAIWVLWPTETYTHSGDAVPKSFAEIVKALEPHVRVNIAARNADEINQIQQYLKGSGYTGTNTHYYSINHMSIWARDVAPVIVRDSQNRLNAVGFGFNNYSRDGSDEYIATESSVHKQIAEALGLPIVKTSLISEGGAIESNGHDVMMAVETVAMKRNPDMTLQQIEDEYKRVLGVSKVIWLKKGLAEDDSITTGHINEFCRFADPSTILLAEVPESDRDANEVTQETNRRMEENLAILQGATDQDGKPFRIVRVPLPPTLYGRAEGSGKTPVRSYLNFAITNGAVVMPLYWKQGLPDELKTVEDGVKQTLADVFPGREMIGIDAESINEWGGGIHCVTQHMPAE